MTVPDGKANDEESDSDLARWLVENADQAFAKFAPKEASSSQATDLFQLASRFHKTFGSQRSPLLCQLFELRQRANAKFARASEMFFTRVGYEQSTSQAIADYKAKRFAGRGKVIDLCCGIGGDAMSIAPVVERLAIVDSSPTVAEFATANLAVHGTSADCIVDDVRAVDMSSYDAWHIDPDRRVDGRRRSTPNSCEPPLDEFLQIVGLAQHGAIKLSPAADATELLQRGAELEWIGNHHECQQLVAWFGDLALHPGKRQATWLSGRPNESTGIATHLVSDSEDLSAERPREISIASETPRYVYEPRPSVLASGLDSTLAAQFGLERLAVRSPYLAANELADSPLFRRFEVIESMPFHQKTLKRRIRELGVCVTEVKKRGVDISPEKLLRELSSGKDREQFESVVVLLYPVGRSVHVVIAKRDD